MSSRSRHLSATSIAPASPGGDPRGVEPRPPPSVQESPAMPRPLRPIDDQLVYHVINRGNNRAPVFFQDGAITAYESFPKPPPPRRRRWSAFVHQAPPDEELAALRRSTQTGLP